jgi:DNA helicase II / ATP-dependent DNA helicase PcrA
LLDYTDMLSGFLSSGIELNLEVVLDDESQDQSHLQWEVIRKIARGARRVAVAGDDDQALYKWAGADVEQFIDLPGSPAVLGTSYRVPRTIQNLASSVISAVAHRRTKEWASRDDEGTIQFASDFEHVDCGEGQIMILTRNIYLLKEIVMPTLKRAGIIYEYNGHSSVSSSILSAIVSWEKLRQGESIAIDAARLVYEYLGSNVGVARGFKKLPSFSDDAYVDMNTLKLSGGLLVDSVWHDAFDRLPKEDMGYVLAARKRGERLLSKPRVRISTIHGAKGDEADHIVLLREMARRTYREMEEDEDSERRVWYVAATRAREKLTIVNANTAQACPWV